MCAVEQIIRKAHLFPFLNMFLRNTRTNNSKGNNFEIFHHDHLKHETLHISGEINFREKQRKQNVFSFPIGFILCREKYVFPIQRIYLASKCPWNQTPRSRLNSAFHAPLKTKKLWTEKIFLVPALSKELSQWIFWNRSPCIYLKYFNISGHPNL